MVNTSNLLTTSLIITLSDMKLPFIAIVTRRSLAASLDPPPFLDHPPTSRPFPLLLLLLPLPLHTRALISIPRPRGQYELRLATVRLVVYATCSKNEAVPIELR